MIAARRTQDDKQLPRRTRCGKSPHGNLPHFRTRATSLDLQEFQTPEKRRQQRWHDPRGIRRAGLKGEAGTGGWNNAAEVVLVDAKSDVSAVRNEVETPGYALLNLRGSYAWKKARLDFGVENVFDRLYYHPLGGAYVGQGITMPPNQTHLGVPAWGTAVPGMGRTLYAGINVQF